MFDEIKKYRHIVFASEHYNPLGIVRSLGQEGINPILICLRSKTKLTSKSKYVKEIYYVDSIKEGYRVLLKVNNKGTNNVNKAFIYTADDSITSFLDERYEELKDKFYFFNAGAPGMVTRYMDKKEILSIAEKYGLQILKTIVVNKGEIPSNLDYPIVTKAITPTMGDWKTDMFICHNDDELKCAYKVIKSDKVLIQKYIYKDNECCLECFSNNHGNDMLITTKILYNYIREDTYSSYMTVHEFKDAETEEKLAKIIQEIGFEGIFEVEFLVSGDQYFFSEINFRTSTWGYASTCAGLSLELLWANSMINNQIRRECLPTHFNSFTAMAEIHDFKYRIVKKQVSTIEWFRQLKNCKCRYYFVLNDLKPVCHYILSKFKI